MNFVDFCSPRKSAQHSLGIFLGRDRLPSVTPCVVRILRQIGTPFYMSPAGDLSGERFGSDFCDFKNREILLVE